MTGDVRSLISDNLDVWTTAIERKTGPGRGNGGRLSFYGIERLRGLILDLAVRGKLEPQDPADEPASDLLRKIEAKKQRLGMKGRAKRLAPPAPPAKWPFDLPGNWAWTQLGSITNYGETEKVNPGEVVDDTWVLELEDIEKGTSRILERVRYKARPFQSQKNSFHAGDVIYGKLRPYLDKVIVADEAGVCTTEMVPMRGYLGIESDYLRLFLKTPYFIDLATNSTHGMNLPRLGTEKAREAPFALPPVAEQQRVVAKVDHLIALCDALERESEGATTAHQALVENLLATLTTAFDAADAARKWERLEAHFDILFTTEASIDAFKRAVLDLAVNGKLIAASGSVSPGVLDDVGDWVGGNGFPKEFQGNASGDIPFLKVSDMNLPGNERRITVSNNWVSAEAIKAMRARVHPAGTIIFPKIGGAIATNKRRILSMPSAIDNNCAGQVPKEGIDTDWLFIMLSSIDMSAYQAGTSVPALNMNRLGNHRIDIPTQPDQQRIVAKVDELMGLCDALKSRLADAAEIQRRLTDAVVEKAAA